MDAVAWILESKEWIFSGMGVAIISGVIALIWRRRGGVNQNQTSGANSTNIQAARDVNLTKEPSKPNDG
jgi:hypothetical protein